VFLAPSLQPMSHWPEKVHGFWATPNRFGPSPSNRTARLGWKKLPLWPSCPAALAMSRVLGGSWPVRGSTGTGRTSSMYATRS
jgi:hypothetical protein